METARFRIFLSLGKFKLSKTQKVFLKVLKKWNLFCSPQHYNYGKRNLKNVNVKGYRSKFAYGKGRLRTFTKRRSVRSLKETITYNKQLTDLTSSGPYWGYWRSVIFLSATSSGQYFPVRPSRSVSKRLVVTFPLWRRLMSIAIPICRRPK